MMMAIASWATSVIAKAEGGNSQKVVVVGDDWGSAVTKTILGFENEIDDTTVQEDDFVVTETKNSIDWTDPSYPEVEVSVERQVLDVYCSDEFGNRVGGNSKYVTIDLYTSPSEGSPFIYRVSSGRNDWCDPYKLAVAPAEKLDAGIKYTDGTDADVSWTGQAINFDTDMICDQLAKFDTTKTFTAFDGTKYSYADYTGDLASDGHSNGLFVWLHGGGEGGTDPSIVLLANEAANFASDEFQKEFDGIYVLEPQCPTMWMDGYDWNGEGGEGVGGSIYSESLMELIMAYVDGNSDIDPSRVYVSGCSNGGYMTMNLAFLYPDYFAAYIPVCEGYRDEDISDDMIETIKYLPLWFVFADADTTLAPEIFSKPTIARLQEAGATDLHVSEFKNVVDTSNRFDDSKGKRYEYSGHWSWIYFDNNECYDEEGINCWKWIATNYATSANSTQVVHVVGDDWGPAVDKTTVTLDTAVKASDLATANLTVKEVKEAFDWSTMSLTTSKSFRTVLDVYLSDADGNKVDDAEGTIITVEMYVSPSEGSPFFYDVFTGFNRWVSQYELVVMGTIGGLFVFDDTNIDFGNTSMWASELADQFNQDTYTATDGTPIVYGEYVPATTGTKPLVVWLHGTGEGTNKGANDNYIDLLGNEVTALASEDFQKNFETGAYVVTPQAPTMWMDDGTGAYQSGDKGSCYEAALFEFIDNYVKTHSDIDADRVIVGGCSNGGYMTMEITMKHPGYFYKAYPICEAFYDEYISDEMVAAVAEGGTAYWFTYALTDTTVNPNVTSIPTIKRFQDAGVEVHVSEWAKVEDLTGRYTNEAGNPYEYMGHWSWIYFDNNSNYEGDLNEWEWLASYFMGFKIADGTEYNYADKEAAIYWYEHGRKQGIYGDKKNITDEIYGLERGREIYDPTSDAWYWLDAVYEGAAAKNKEVWMPYIYQNEVPGSTEGKWVRYDKYDQMIKGWYANDNGVYYYDLITGEMYKGVRTIEGKTYTFDPVTGVRQ